MEKNTEQVDLAKEKALSFAKNSLDKSLVHNIVVKVTEFLLPITFWIGLLTILKLSWEASSYFFRYNEFIAGVTTFTVFFIPYSVAFIVSFYLLYLLKDIRDSLQNKA